MYRRDFLKLAGSAAGAAAVYTFLPHVTIAGGRPVYTISTSTIARPSFTAPEIVKSGGAIPCAMSATAKTEVESAWLHGANGGSRVALSLETGGTAEGAPTALLPQSDPDPGMYDLFISAARGNKKRVERLPMAVKIVEDYKTDFEFGIISDVHFGDPRITADIPGFDVAETFRKEIAILNERNIEFCICCGDLCFLPPETKKQIAEYMDTLSARATFPTFTVPGNHDGYATGSTSKINFDTYKYWRRTFGPFHYEASYGDIPLIGINTYEREPKQRNLYGGFGESLDMGVIGAAQLEWLDATLARTTGSAGGAAIMFGHHNPTNTFMDMNGPFSVLPFSETGRLQLLGLVEKYSPDYFFTGHLHAVFAEKYKDTNILTVPTAASRPAQGHPIGFQIATVKNSRISSIETIEMLRP